MSKHTLQVVILAAGKGTRLLPLTSTRTKAMLPVLGKPMIERVMDEFIACGVDEFIVVINPVSQEFMQHLQNKSELQAMCQFVHQDVPLGTADALRKAAPLIRNDFILRNYERRIR